ncbi:MAG: DnaD domain protein, partial [Acholeplasmataceae bacterium]|nr:DnaD domain protein [Acholeplasmataceae bacterium]
DLPIDDGFVNITKSFDEMYEFKSVSLLNVSYPLQGRVQNGGSHINYKFNYEAFIDHLPERLKTSQLLTEKFKDTITKIAFVYQFDVSDLVTIYEAASKSKQNVNFAALNLKARQHYEQKHKLLTIKQKDMPIPTLFDQVAPQVIIQKYAKTDQQGIALSTATALLERNNVEPGIINVILMLILKHKDGILPNINYLEKVLIDWTNKGVQTTEDAINYSTNLENQWETKQKSQKQTVSKPDWLDDYITDLVKMEE